MIFETRRIVEPRFLRFSAVKNTICRCVRNLIAFIAERHILQHTALISGEMLGTGCTFRKLYTEEDGSCKGEAFLRCINDEDLANDLDALKEIAAKYDVEIVVRDSDNEYYKPTSLESDGYKYVRKIVQSVFDYAAAVPFILPAGTDARRFTGLSDSVIRFAPIDIDGQQYASVHSENENINVDKIPLAVKFYKELLRNYK